MTDEQTTEERIADGLERWTAELDRIDGIQVRAILAAAALQLAKRIGPDRAAQDVHDLGHSLHRETMQ